MDIKLDSFTYLYSFLIIEPAHSGINRYYRTTGAFCKFDPLSSKEYSIRPAGRNSGRQEGLQFHFRIERLRS
jgi:hypothetical protein